MFWDVMKLFHPGVERLLNGVEIDRPFNAMTMTVDLHQSFGALKWYLEEDSHQPEVRKSSYNSPNFISVHYFDRLVP